MSETVEKLGKREKILEAAKRCFMKSGVSHTRMREIALEAKVDQPLVNYYFPNLDSLYLGVITIVLNQLKDTTIQAIALGQGHPIKTLKTYIQAYFEWGSQHKGECSLWLYFYYLCSFNPLFTQLNDTIRVTGRDRIAVLIYQGLEKKHFTLPEDISVNDLATNIQGIITGNMLLAATEGALPFSHYGHLAEKEILKLLT